MAEAHDHLRRMLRGEAHRDGPWPWHHVLAALHEVSAAESEESHQLMREAAVFSGALALDPGQGMPHARPPEEVLRLHAIRVLATWDIGRHRDVIAAAGRLAHGDLLAGMARRLL